MKRVKIILASIIIILSSFILCGCENSSDTVEIYSKSPFIFDDVNIVLPDGFFYSKHEKRKIDNDTLELVITFTRDGTDDWKIED